MAENGPVTNAEHSPQFPETELVKKAETDAKQAHASILGNFANLALPVAGGTADPSTINAAIEQSKAHAETTRFFSEIFALQRKGTLIREELDKRLVNWALNIPGLKERFDELPHNVRTCVDEFKDSDLSGNNPVPHAVGFKPPPSMSTIKKINKLKDALEKQRLADEWKKYPDIVEKNGDRVAYVEKFPFENWGETVANTPTVKKKFSLKNVLILDYLHSQKRRRRPKYCQVR
jgi:hypothetical protein